MIKPHVQFLKNCIFIADITITSFLFPLAVGLHNRLGEMISKGFFIFIATQVNWEITQYSYFLIWLIPIWYGALSYFNAYDTFRNKDVIKIIFTVINASVVVSVIFAFVFLININIANKYKMGYSIVLVYPAICALTLTISRIFLINLFRIIRRLGYNQRRLIIVGTGKRAVEHFEKIKLHPEWGFNFLGFITLEKFDQLPGEIAQYPVIGTLSDISSILTRNPVDEILFIVPRKWLDEIDDAVMNCDLLGVTVHIAVDLFSIKISKSSISTFYDLPVLSFNTISTNYSALVVKRFADFFISLVGLILFLPFGLLISLLIKLESNGPIFFIQKRCGMNGRIFPMLKFRTMIQNAEELKKSLLSENEQDGPVFKMKNDPRVTKLGKFLRKTSIDEIPQLLNVLIGQMSIVGPRPPLPSEVEKYEPWQKRKLSMRPGITCIWQVSGRNEITFERWMEMDLEYIDNWSLALDFYILLKTIPIVLIAKGNH
ncbi:MAG: hypothetical protein ACD_79C01216G0003 [uncultured bacterium]|nr:MAG: hypothetical protein ACD_79C01216G0003 [uncultured bacterium]